MTPTIRAILGPIVQDQGRKSPSTIPKFPRSAELSPLYSLGFSSKLRKGSGLLGHGAGTLIVKELISSRLCSDQHFCSGKLTDDLY